MATAIVMIPALRLEVLGTSLRYHLEPGKISRVAVLVNLERGQEIVGEDTDPNSDPPIQEDHQAGYVMEEEVKLVEGEPVLTYRLTELRSEQWDWTKGSLGGARFDLRLFPNGLPNSLERSIPKESALTDPTVVEPLFAMLWPRLPSGLVKAEGRQWNGQLTVETQPSLLEKPIGLEHNLVYEVRKFQPTSGGKVAAVHCRGNVRHESQGVTAEGMLEGACLVDPATGLTTGADYRLQQRIRVKLDNLPEYRWFQAQSVQMWRVPEENEVAEGEQPKP